MNLESDIREWLPRVRARLQRADLAPRLQAVGRVERIGDGVVTISGLPDTRLDELLQFEDGTLGIALRIGEDAIGCALLDHGEAIRAGSRVHGTGRIIRVPVGEALLGRVVDPIGRPLDDGPPIDAERMDPIERPAPGIVERDLVSEPLLTGLTVIDAMIPLGRGQRELIIGDRQTGKTTVAIDTMINQRGSDVVCIYAAIGQKSSSVARVIRALRAHDAFDNCIVVMGASDATPGTQWTTPYAACTMAEYFRDRGRDALLIFDDLTKHAIVYREISLLLRKPPGREAYPGDVFYLHARLLERAAKMSEDLGGGSLTALPIAETQAGNLTAYIPTNLISITDGQVYLEPKLFYEGQKPAVNVGMSVSRVGGATQARAIKEIAESLKLDYTQFLELEVFTRFGTMVDERTAKRIEHGRRIRAILTQPEYSPLSLALQVALLLAVAERKLEALPPDLIPKLRARLAEALDAQCPQAVYNITQGNTVSQDDRAAIVAVLDDCIAALTPRG